MSHRYHNSLDPACKTPFGAVEAGQPVTVRLFLPAGVGCYAPLLLLYQVDDWAQPAAMVGMEYDHTTSDGRRCLRGDFVLPWPGLYYYCFQLSADGRRQRILRGEKGEGVLDTRGDLWQITATRPGFSTPRRFKGGVIYQIFPDRFCKGGEAPQNIPAGREFHDLWGESPKYLPDPDGEYRPNDFFGGDLEGIRQKLPYLQSLGVTTLYLNPIFEAHSNHRYNTADYRAIDPLLGTEEDFARLCSEAKEWGISVLLDGVFSHTGSDSRYFNREGRYPDPGAYQSEQSPYHSWFKFYNFPDGYQSWWGFETLPEVTEDDPAYMDFICGREGVLHKWMELGAAGWRLDVADELPDGFLDRLHRSVKEKDPEALVLGEVWEDASNKQAYGQRRRYLQGDQLDSVMNYPFRDAVLDFIKEKDSERFLLRVLELLEHYPKCVCDVLMNLLSTHDVERALTTLGGEPAGGRDRRWQGEHNYFSPEQYGVGKQRLKLAALLQYTLPGIPSLYYGDEAGLYGYRDPFNRGCYPWGKEDADLVAFFGALGQFRLAQPTLAEGIFQPVESSFGCVRYLRRQDGQALFVAVNAADEDCTITLPHGFTPTAPAFVVGRWEERRRRLGGRSGILLAGQMEE